MPIKTNPVEWRIVILSRQLGWDMRKYLLFAGILAPLVYVATVIIGGASTPGYDHLAQPVSALFEVGAPYATPISAAFVLYNLLLLVFGIALLATTGTRHLAIRLGAILILLNGLFGVAIELAPMDAQGTPVTLPGIIHMVLAGLLVLTCMAAMATMALGWLKLKQHPTITKTTIALLPLMLVSGALAASVAAQNWPLMGLYQRLTIGSYLVWILALATVRLREPE